MVLRTIETVSDREVELGSSEVLLFSLLGCPDPEPCPSSFPFAIPLTPDTPQSIQTSYSSLSHHLTATLYPHDTTSPPIFRTLTVHTKRYTAHTYTLLTTPEVFSLDQPSRIEVEVPRTTFQVGEPIPIYVTVPPPPREVVTNEGWRLRNIRVELVRFVKTRHDFDRGLDLHWQEEAFEKDVQEDASASDGHSATFSDTLSEPSSSSFSSSHPHSDSMQKTTIGRSGASCRFHSSRPVRLRFLLHQASCSPYDVPINLPPGDNRIQDSDADSPSITQLTIFHSVTFRLVINVAFLNAITRRETIATISIPITMMPPPAPLPEVSPEVDIAYQKKYDNPPLKTVRNDEADHPVPHYSEGEAGPSVLPTSAPPPFEEQDAPPPFWFAESRASTSTRLPSFLESESEIILPEDLAQELLHPPLPDPIIIGEGSEFGFLSSDQFDGHTEPLSQRCSPPPSLEMATGDMDLTSFADTSEPQFALEALGLVLDPDDTVVNVASSPPPPPAMDDPSDPPPSIDSDFRSPDMPLQTSTTPSTHTSTIPLSSLTSDEHLRSTHDQAPRQTDGPAPPPYLNPGVHSHQVNVTRPPPYVD